MLFKNKTILVVNDDLGVRMALTGLMTVRLVGSKIIEASTGTEALEIAKKDHIDLMVLEEVLPGCSAMELLIKLHELNIIIPSIIFTGLLQSDFIVDPRLKNRLWIVEKPVRFLDVQLLVRQILTEEASGVSTS